jgi:hypothetical protein
VTNLKRIILACGVRRVIIITPGPRYLTQPCCCSNEHCTHLLIPESGLKLMTDLSRLHLFIQRRLSSSPNVVVVPAGDLLVGKKAASPEETLFAFSSWGSVHGTTASYTRMALTLVDCHFSKTPPATPVVPPRPHSIRRDRGPSPPLPMILVPSPASQYRRCPASEHQTPAGCPLVMSGGRTVK